MYNPPSFREERREILHDFIDRHNFGVVVTSGGSELLASHLPFILDREAGEFGVLRAHVAKANRQWKDSDPAIDGLAIFQGPAAYVSPSWYPSKQESGKVVPTYNYMVVHASGPVRFSEDPTELESLVRQLTDVHEAIVASSWTIDEPPRSFLEAQLHGIVLVEIPIRKLEGKWKLSQNRSPEDQTGVIEGLDKLPNSADLSNAMRDRVE